jgi:hypothetical protein
MGLESAAASTTATDESAHSTRSTATTTVTASLLQQEATAAAVVVVSKSSATTTDLDPSQFSRDTTRHPGFYQQQQVTKSTNILPMVRFFGCFFVCLAGWRSNKGKNKDSFKSYATS